MRARNIIASLIFTVGCGVLAYALMNKFWPPPIATIIRSEPESRDEEFRAMRTDFPEDGPIFYSDGSAGNFQNWEIKGRRYTKREKDRPNTFDVCVLKHWRDNDQYADNIFMAGMSLDENNRFNFMTIGSFSWQPTLDRTTKEFDNKLEMFANARDQEPFFARDGIMEVLSRADGSPESGHKAGTHLSSTHLKDATWSSLKNADLIRITTPSTPKPFEVDFTSWGKGKIWESFNECLAAYKPIKE